MRITPKQQKELKVWEYFIPKNVQWQEKTDKDIEKFFEWSERGKHKEEAQLLQYLPEGRTYFHALIWGKKYANITIHELWEPTFGTNTWPGYFYLLGGFENNKKFWQFWKSPHKPMPREVVDYMKKEMFQGTDAEAIESCYREVKSMV